jgi:hypothetical protein
VALCMTRRDDLAELLPVDLVHAARGRASRPSWCD